MHQHTSLLQILLDDIVEIIKENSDVLLLPIEQRIHNMMNPFLIRDVIHILRRSHHYFSSCLPVLMDCSRKKSRFIADWASPMKRWLPVSAWV